MKDSKFQTYIAQTVANEIRLADTKASWTFSVLGLTGAALTNRITKLPTEQIMTAKNLVLISISIVLILLAIKHTMAVIYPRITKAKKEGVTYFANITEYKQEEYTKKAMNITEEEAIKELTILTYNLSQVAKRKFYHLRIAIIYTLLALLTTISVISFI